MQIPKASYPLSGQCLRKNLHVFAKVSEGVVVRIVCWWRISNFVWAIVMFSMGEDLRRATVTTKLVPPPSTAARRACLGVCVIFNVCNEQEEE